ncbi:MAG: ATP-binding protein, partial [Thermomicrobiales bacterium]
MNERNQQQRTPDTPAADKASPLSAREAAESLGVHERTIRRAIARGDLPATKRSGMWEIHGANLIDWSAKHSRSNHAIPAIQPLSTAPTTPPFRVPTPRTPLFGRVREVRNIVERIGDPRCALVTLTGPGGSGKTRLALAAAAETAGQFADGICFIDLSSLHDAGLVLPGIATALDLNAAAERSVYERLRAWLAPRTALLILDNVEHVTPAAIDLARLLEDCPGLTILTTSRVALKLSMEHQIPIPPLQLPPRMPECDLAVTGASPAVQLFIWRARTFDPSFALTTSNAKTIEEICRRLDGLPLAIELAAAHTRILALTDLLDRLRLSMLSDGPANQPDRLRSLRRAIDWSYALLAPESQRAFRAIAVFADGFGPDAVAWVMGIDSDQ